MYCLQLPFLVALMWCQAESMWYTSSAKPSDFGNTAADFHQYKEDLSWGTAMAMKLTDIHDKVKWEYQ